jgi:DUF1009 family protein
MAELKKPIGLIAGGGNFPLIIARSVKRQGRSLVAVAHLGQTDPALEEVVDKIVWVKLGQFGQILKVLEKNQVRHALMAGSIDKRSIYSNIRPDLKGLTIMSKIAIFHDDGILRAVAREFETRGIEIISSVHFMPELLAPEGCLTRRKPTPAQREDILFGWEVAKNLGRLDIGQCVVVRKKTVVALEAIEGTDEAILRGGRLAREKAVVVKVSKPDQDLRFDVPSVGLRTLEVMGEVKAAVLALEAGKTLMFDREKMITYADRNGMTIVSR